MATPDLAIPDGMHIANTGPEVPNEPPAPREPTARERMMLDIVANAEKQRGMELAYGEQQSISARREAMQSDPLLEAEEAAVAEEEATEAARRALADGVPEPIRAAPVVQPQPQPQQPQVRTVRIDGQEFSVTEAQFEALARDGMLARQTVARYQQQPPAPQAPPEPQPLLSEEEARRFAKKFQYGDENETAQSVRELVDTIVQRTPRGPQIDPNAIVNAAVQQARQQQTHESNLDTIGREFPDVFVDQTLSELAALKLAKIRSRNQALGVTVPDIDTFREACGQVRAAISPRQQQLQPEQETSPALQAAPSSRLERKRAAPSIPNAADRRAGATQPRTYPSASDYVEKLRAQRGQMPMR